MKYRTITKCILLLCACICLTKMTFAQSESLSAYSPDDGDDSVVTEKEVSEKRNKMKYRNNIKVGVGYQMAAWRWSIPSKYPVFSFQYDRRISRAGLSAVLAHGMFKGYSRKTYMSKIAHIIILGLRANYFFLQNGHCDIYGGGMVSALTVDDVYSPVDYSYSHFTPTYSNTNTSGDKLAREEMGFKWGVQAGCNVWIKRHTGLFAEIGYGIAVFNLGCIIRL